MTETTDLLPESCVTTLKAIASYLNLPFSGSISDVASISYNSFQNRLWSRQPAKAFPISAFFYVYPVYAAPAKMFDFWFNQWQKAHTLATFKHNGHEFVAGMPEDRYNDIAQYINEKFFDEFKIKALKTYLKIWSRHCELTLKLYEQYSITAEQAVEAIRGNKKFRSRFLKVMDREVSSFAVDYPEIVKRWKYFNSI